jgi:polar amino acid transport system substrate-binding protein
MAGCQVPSDPDATLERVRGGPVRVGVSENDPWVRVEGRAGKGVEPILIERFARTLRARVEWYPGSEAELMDSLHEGQLDLVVAGLTHDTPWHRKAALTRPYARTSLVVGLPPGTATRKSLEGVNVAVETGHEAAGLVERKTDASVLPVEDLTAARGRPAAVPEWLLDDLGLEASGVRLKQEKHVMAAPMGENAWLSALERFLLRREAEVRHLLDEEGRP